MQTAQVIRLLLTVACVVNSRVAVGGDRDGDPVSRTLTNGARLEFRCNCPADDESLPERTVELVRKNKRDTVLSAVPQRDDCKKIPTALKEVVIVEDVRADRLLIVLREGRNTSHWFAAYEVPLFSADTSISYDVRSARYLINNGQEVEDARRDVIFDAIPALPTAFLTKDSKFRWRGELARRVPRIATAEAVADEDGKSAWQLSVECGKLQGTFRQKIGKRGWREIDTKVQEK